MTLLHIIHLQFLKSKRNNLDKIIIFLDKFIIRIRLHRKSRSEKSLRREKRGFISVCSEKSVFHDTVVDAHQAALGFSAAAACDVAIDKEDIGFAVVGESKVFSG